MLNGKNDEQKKTVKCGSMQKNRSGSGLYFQRDALSAPYHTDYDYCRD